MSREDVSFFMPLHFKNLLVSVRLYIFVKLGRVLSTMLSGINCVLTDITIYHGHYFPEINMIMYSSLQTTNYFSDESRSSSPADVCSTPHRDGLAELRASSIDSLGHGWWRPSFSLTHRHNQPRVPAIGKPHSLLLLRKHLFPTREREKKRKGKKTRCYATFE